MSFANIPNSREAIHALDRAPRILHIAVEVYNSTSQKECSFRMQFPSIFDTKVSKARRRDIFLNCVDVAHHRVGGAFFLPPFVKFYFSSVSMLLKTHIDITAYHSISLLSVHATCYP